MRPVSQASSSLLPRFPAPCALCSSRELLASPAIPNTVRPMLLKRLLRKRRLCKQCVTVYILVNLLLVVLYRIQQPDSLQYDWQHPTHRLLFCLFQNGGKHHTTDGLHKLHDYTIYVSTGLVKDERLPFTFS